MDGCEGHVLVVLTLVGRTFGLERAGYVWHGVFGKGFEQRGGIFRSEVLG